MVYYYIVKLAGEKMEILTGTKLKEKILTNIKKETNLLNLHITITIISIGDNQINSIFFKERTKMCHFLNWQINHYHYEMITESSLLDLIKKLNSDPHITGIMLDLPLPPTLNYLKIVSAIDPNKDIDALNPLNHFNFLAQKFTFQPSTVLGIIMLLDGYSINVEEQKVVILNRSNRIGKPLFEYFLTKNCTVTLLHQNSKDINPYLENADIIITATGTHQLLNQLTFKKNALLIDVGCCYQNGILTGDIKDKNQLTNLNYFIPSIGGVGPMTIAALAQNTLKSCYQNLKNKQDVDN